jgi:hypothetical protein
MTKERPWLDVTTFIAPDRGNFTEIPDHENLVGLVEVGEAQVVSNTSFPSACSNRITRWRVTP